MSPEPTQVPAEPRVTLDDLRHRALAVKSMAVSDAKDAANEVIGENGGRTLLIMAGVVLLAASVAFWLGSSTKPMPPVE